jgi:fatty-acyl-CoA synthase
MFAQATRLAVLAGVGAKVFAQSGVVRPYSPRAAVALARSVAAHGIGPAAGFASLAIREPHRVGLIDELGSLTNLEIHRRSNALARGLRASGVGPGDRVAVMCANHRGFVEATSAIAKLGAHALFLNTSFSLPQVRDLLRREAPSLVIHDVTYADAVPDLPGQVKVLGWVDAGVVPATSTIEGLISAHSDADLRAPDVRSKIIILTSGTTGAPKGAARDVAGMDAAVGLLERIPYRFGQRTFVAPPLFHAWGFAHLALGMLLGSTLVLRRGFDPEAVLAALRDERCEALAVVPVMLQRLLALPPDRLAAYDLPGLRLVAASGSALPGDLARQWMDRFGDHLYNVYGSTEVGYASIATPAELRRAPTCAGRPPRGTTVRLLDSADREVERGDSGRIFVGGSLLFAGYTDGKQKQVVDGLMSTGDVGRFDTSGLLYVEGRDDEMIVSGGENVFPSEVEDCLARHPGVSEAAVVGVPDREFGQRLLAYVVRAEATGGGEPDDAVLKEWVRTQLARFKVPREVLFVAELPRNATGKVVKGDLPGAG